MIRLRNLLFPQRCPCCGEPAEYSDTLCPKCEKAVTRIHGPYCTRCGSSLSRCKCKKRPPAYEEVIAPFYYEGAVSRMLLQYKYHGRQDLAVFFAKELGRELRARTFGISFDRIACIPASADRIAERGYDQSRLLLECLQEDPISGFLHGTKRDPGLLVKHSVGSMQHFLSAAERRENIAQAFTVRNGRSVEGETVLLLDDIITTGATMQECAKLLRLEGAREVFAACVAVTPYTGESLHPTRKSILF